MAATVIVIDPNTLSTKKKIKRQQIINTLFANVVITSVVIPWSDFLKHAENN